MVIPRSTIDLSEKQLYMLVNEIRPQDEDNNYGIILYLRAVMLIDEQLESEELGRYIKYYCIYVILYLLQSTNSLTDIWQNNLMNNLSVNMY